MFQLSLFHAAGDTDGTVITYEWTVLKLSQGCNFINCSQGIKLIDYLMTFSQASLTLSMHTQNFYKGTMETYRHLSDSLWF